MKKKKLYRVSSSYDNMFTFGETNELGFMILFPIFKYPNDNTNVFDLEKGNTYIKGNPVYRNIQHIKDLYDVKTDGTLIGYNDDVDKFDLTVDDLAVANQHSVIVEDYQFNAEKNDTLYVCTNLDLLSIDESKCIRVETNTEVQYYGEEQNELAVSGILVTIVKDGTLYQMCKSLLRIKPIE